MWQGRGVSWLAVFQQTDTIECFENEMPVMRYKNNPRAVLHSLTGCRQKKLAQPGIKQILIVIIYL